MHLPARARVCRRCWIIALAAAAFCPDASVRAQFASAPPNSLSAALVIDIVPDYFSATHSGPLNLTDTPASKLTARLKESWSVPATLASQKGRVVATLFMDWKGEVADVSIVQPSPIAAFNTAASNALAHLNPTPLHA